MKSCLKFKYLLGTYVHAAPTTDALLLQHQRAVIVIEYRIAQYLRLRANMETIHATGTTFTPRRADTQQTLAADHPIQGTQRAEVTTPAMLGDQQIEEEDRQDQPQPGARAEDQATSLDRDGVKPLPQQRAADGATDQDGQQDAVA